MAAGWEEMTAAVKMAFEGNWYLLFFFVGLVYLLIAEKKWRNFTIPGLILKQAMEVFPRFQYLHRTTTVSLMMCKRCVQELLALSMSRC